MKNKRVFLGISFALLASTLLLSGCVGGEDFVKFRGNNYAKGEEKLQCDFSSLTAIDPNDVNIGGKQVFVPTSQADRNAPTEIYISNLGACAVYNLKQ